MGEIKHIHDFLLCLLEFENLNPLFRPWKTRFSWRSPWIIFKKFVPNNFDLGLKIDLSGVALCSKSFQMFFRIKCASKIIIFVSPLLEIEMRHSTDQIWNLFFHQNKNFTFRVENFEIFKLTPRRQEESREWHIQSCQTKPDEQKHPFWSYPW